MPAVRRLLALVALGLCLTAGNAAAAEIVLRDDAGRPIRFDVRVEGLDPEPYAAVLRRAAHGDEIATVTVRIVAFSELRGTCGEQAAACYNGGRGGTGTIVVPAAEDAESLHTLLHEYGHHIDRSRPHGGLPEPNGTPLWWRARGIARLVSLGSVSRDYLLGWDRSIAEVFAEDYAASQAEGAYAIRWLEPPDDTVKQAILADLGLAQPPALAEPASPAIVPVVIARSGALAARAQVNATFGLLGPGRRATLTATVTGAARRGTRARVELVCAGRRLGMRPLTRGVARVTLDLRGLGPARCSARVVSLSPVRLRFTLTVRLTVAS